MITLDGLTTCDSIRHGFLTRQGGVSGGLFASLNCGLGSGDDLDHVAENRARAVARLGLAAAALVTVYQIHSPTVVTVDEPWLPASAPQADGLVTRRSGIVLGVLSADCVPVLFADPKAGVIGAAHAGWRGALHGVLENTLRAMVGLGATVANIRAGIGPAIQQRSYEVGEEFADTFIRESASSADFFAPAGRAEHFFFDLPKFVEHRLAQAGVMAVGRSPLDTLSEEEHFFSYRRATHRGEPVYGRGLSLIGLV